MSDPKYVANHYLDMISKGAGKDKRVPGSLFFNITEGSHA